MSSRFFHRERRPSKEEWSLDKELLRWSHDDAWTVRDAVAGTAILGGTSSGKTTGSGRRIALAMLRGGFGGLVLTAKPGECDLWRRYCRETGREADLVVFRPDGGLCFDPLGFEFARKQQGGGHTENIVTLISTLLEVAEKNGSGNGGRENEQYWASAKKQLCRNAVDLLALGRGRVSIPEAYRLVITAPTDPGMIGKKEWQEKSFCYQCLAAAEKAQKLPRQQADFEVVMDYWLLEFPGLSSRTRSVVVSSFTAAADILNRGVLRELHSGESNITPEVVEDGRILVIDLPVKSYGQIGLFSQLLWKASFQSHIERRDLSVNGRPVFLWVDEMQHLVTPLDAQFQATCRSSRVASVLLTQNIGGVHAALGGGSKGRSETDALLGNLSTKIVHASSDPVTNEWASSLIGKSLQCFASGNSSSSAEDEQAAMLGLDWLRGSRSSSAGFSERHEFEVQPREFTTLRTGGPANGWIVDGILFQNGRVFKATGKTWMSVTFQQRP